jgi:hypothetical protein
VKTASARTSRKILIAVEAIARGGASVAGRGRGLPKDGSSHTAHPEDFGVPDATFACADLTMFCRLDYTLDREEPDIDLVLQLDAGADEPAVVEDWTAQ